MSNENIHDIDEMVRITMIDENGNEAVFEHVLTFMYENERYMALAPEDAEDAEEVEIIFMRIEPRKLDGEDAYVYIDNEVLQEELFDVFMELLSEDDLDDMDGE